MLTRQAEDLVRSVDPTPIGSVQRLKDARDDLLVRCDSGRSHLVRFARDPTTLLQERWGYETLKRGGIPCPDVEAAVPPCDDFPRGCLVISWVDNTITASEFIEKHGRCSVTLQLCRLLGKALRALHSVVPKGEVPEYVGRSTRQSAHDYACRKASQLRQAGLIDTDYERKFVALSADCTRRIPEPHPPTFYFADMHFSNILVTNTAEPDVAGFIDVAESGIGWPMWDFTNWERWELLHCHRWVREPVLQAYGPLDMALYRFALLVRFSESHDLFRGAIYRQISSAVQSGDIMAMDLDGMHGN